MRRRTRRKLTRSSSSPDGRTLQRFTDGRSSTSDVLSYREARRVWLHEPPLTNVFRRRENDGEPVNDRRLRSQIDNGIIVRIARGAFVERQAWEALTPLARQSA